MRIRTEPTARKQPSSTLRPVVTLLLLPLKLPLGERIATGYLPYYVSSKIEEMLSPARTRVVLGCLLEKSIYALVVIFSKFLRAHWVCTAPFNPIRRSLSP